MSLIIDRLEFQRQYATGRIINLGCSGNPAGLRAALHVDMRPGPFVDGPTPHPFWQGDARHVPRPDDSFDTAVMGEILEHFSTEEDAMEALREARRLAPNLVATVPRDDRMLGRAKWEEDTACPPGETHVLWISADRLWRMLRDTGWDVILWMQTTYGWCPCGWAVLAQRANTQVAATMEVEYQLRLKERFGT